MPPKTVEMPDAPAPDAALATAQIPAQLRGLMLRSETWSPEARTIEVVASTGARVARFDWESWGWVDEELVMSPRAVRLDRLNRGASVLNSHDSSSLDAVIGKVVEGSARLEGGQLVATLQLSGRAEIAGLVEDIAAGIIRNISIGYIVHRYEIERREGARDLFRAMDWEPHEISFVPVPADAAAQARGGGAQGAFPCLISRALPALEEKTMKIDEPAGQAAPESQARAADPAPAPTAPATVKAARVREAAAGFDAGVREELLAMHADAPFTEERLMAEIGRRFAALDSAQPERRAPATVTVDEAEKRRGAAIEAIVHRGKGSREGFKAGGELFRGMRLLDIGCELAGVNTRGLTNSERVSHLIARSTHVSADFPLVLGAVANKFLRDAYEASPQTFRPFTRTRSVADFKTITVTALGDAPRLLQVPAGGEVKWGTIGESAETYAVAQYARALSVTEVMLVNDDLDAFTRLPTMFARSAADLESDLVYTSILVGNPSLRTGGALFQAAAARGNNLITSGTAISVDSLGVGEATMMSQRSIDGNPMNVRPAFLVTGPARSVLARQMTAATIVPSAPANTNPFAGQLQPIVDARITGNMWFLIADPASIDTIELAYIDGEMGPVIEEFAEVSRLGITLRAKHNVGAAPIDFRGMFRNAGA